jgi:type II secretory pathway pseudopilin PulG
MKTAFSFELPALRKKIFQRHSYVLKARSPKPTATQSGMTLLEAVIWIAIFTMVMITLTQSLLSFYRTNRYAFQEAEAISSAQKGMNAAVEALRTASYSNNGAYPLVSIAPNQVSFYASVIKGDPLIQEVRLFVQGTALYEGTIEPSGDPLSYASSTEVVTDLSNYVQNLTVGTSTFIYYNENGNPMTSYGNYQDVRLVTINLIVDVSTSSLPTQLTITSSAALRNLITH